jgi:hypothetical protein
LWDDVLLKWLAFIEGNSDLAAGHPPVPIESLPEEPRFAELSPRVNQGLEVEPVTWRPHPYFHYLVTLWVGKTGIGPYPSREGLTTLEMHLDDKSREIHSFARTGGENEESPDDRGRVIDPTPWRGNTEGDPDAQCHESVKYPEFLEGWVYPVVWKTIYGWWQPDKVACDSALRWRYPSWLIHPPLVLDDPWNATLFPSRELVLAHPYLAYYDFQFPKWDPRTETREEVRKRIEKEFHFFLNHALDRDERHFKNAGCKRAEAPLPSQFFKWPVQWQILRRNRSQIGKADPDRPDGRKVERGINRAARAVYGHNWELWLRPAKMGRPGKEPS